LPVVRCLIKEFEANVNLTMADGQTALIMSARFKHEVIIKHLVHRGALVRAISANGHTAATMLRAEGGTPAQIAYLDVRMDCSNPGCGGGGFKRCAVCKEMTGSCTVGRAAYISRRGSGWEASAKITYGMLALQAYTVDIRSTNAPFFLFDNNYHTLS
jgi:hypothetical protein